jgi:hypothetical protein
MSSFLWKATPFKSTDFRVGHSIKTFTWTGKNEYYIFTNSQFLNVGGGDGKFGLWIDAKFSKGFTTKCPAFDNKPLTQNWIGGISGVDESGFDVHMFEIWKV